MSPTIHTFQDSYSAALTQLNDSAPRKSISPSSPPGTPMTHQPATFKDTTNTTTTTGNHTHPISPASTEENAMSPSLDHRGDVTHDYQLNGNYQPNFINRNGSGTCAGSMNQYTSSPPPKNSFCIDALLSKNQTDNMTNQERSSPEPTNNNRFMTDEDVFRKYSDEREYTPSPDETTSR